MCLKNYLKTFARWQKLESITAYEFIQRYGGISAWKVLWEPLFKLKFGDYYKDIPASWFWARIVKRTSDLGYPVFGFEAFAETKWSAVVIFFRRRLRL